jgi:hypothetical protein
MAFDERENPAMNPVPLSYGTPRHPTPTIWLHHVARLCGVAPLGFGTLVFVMFLMTRDETFAVLGFFTILAGIGLAFVGIVCAAVYLYQAKRAGPEDRDRALRQGHRDVLIILANFPIAFVMAWAGVSMIPGR